MLGVGVGVGGSEVTSQILPGAYIKDHIAMCLH